MAGNRRDLEAALGRLAPRIPRFESGAVMDHALSSPTLGRSSPEEAAWLSMVAVVRHMLTDYDDLLADGYDVETARHLVADSMTETLSIWGVKRKL